MRKNIVKKLLKTIFIIAVLLMLVMPKQEIAASKVKLGDINGDSKIDQTDIVFLLRHISATTNKNHEEWLLTGDKLKLADVTENNTIDTSDVLALLRYIAANQSNEVAKKHPEWLEIEENDSDSTPPKVVPATDVNLSKAQATLYAGNAKLGRIKIVEAKITPSNVTNKEVTWETTDKSVATVEKAKVKGIYYIKTKINNKVLSVEGNKTTNSAKIQVKENKELDSQKYELIDVGYDYYIIRVKSTGKVLDVQRNQKDNSTQVIQYDLNGNENQLWKLEDAGNGYKYIVSRSSGLYLDIQGGKAKEGDKLIIYKGNKKDNQKFKLEEIKNETVDEKGLAIIEAKKDGTAKITAKTSNGMVSKECKVKVKTLVTSVKLSKTTMEIDFGKTKTATLKATILPSTATDKTITWSSSDTKIATVNKNGKITAKKTGTITITAKSNNEKKATCKVTIKAGFWEVKNGKYIYHYLNGTKKEWTVSEYISWKKLKEQKVKAMDPTAFTKKGNRIHYLGFDSYCRIDWDGPNKYAIKKGRSPYAITVDINRKYESIFENHNGLWEPIKSTRVRVGKKFENYASVDKKMYPTNCTTPVGLYYTNGGRWPRTSDGIKYWVAFGVNGRGGSKQGEQTDYFHDCSYSKDLNVRNWRMCCHHRR